MLQLSRMPDGEPEIFTSIQGEGISAGTPSVFVRLATCNLRCTWCDTKYTWDWSQFDPKLEIVALDARDVADRVRSARTANVVVTGGEPLLQQRVLGDLGALLKEDQLRIEVETSGTVVPSGQFADFVDQWNVSPKLANSHNPVKDREIPDALAWFAAHPSAWFKFVVASHDDVVEAIALAARYAVPRNRILLMPEGADPVTIEERSRWVVEECLRAGVRYSPRLHIQFWGAERGR